MSGLAAGSTPSFSAAASTALHESRRRALTKAARKRWKELSSRLMKSHGAPAAPDPPAVATGTLSSNDDSSRDSDNRENEPTEAPGAMGGKAFTPLGAQ